MGNFIISYSKSCLHSGLKNKDATVWMRELSKPTHQTGPFNGHDISAHGALFRESFLKFNKYLFSSFQRKKKKGFGSCAPVLERQDIFHVLSRHFLSRAQHTQRLHHLKRNYYTKQRCLEYHTYDLQWHELWSFHEVRLSQVLLWKQKSLKEHNQSICLHDK